MGGGRKGRPNLVIHILSILCSFREIFAKLYVGAPSPPGELAPPPRGNPGSATDQLCVIIKQYSGFSQTVNNGNTLLVMLHVASKG